MRKKKIFGVIFKLSFIPYVILVLISIYYAIAGYDVYTWILPEYVRTIYGLEAFAETLSLNVFSLCFVLPILPVIIIYQLVYITIGVINRIKRKKAIDSSKSNL